MNAMHAFVLLGLFADLEPNETSSEICCAQLSGGPLSRMHFGITTTIKPTPRRRQRDNWATVKNGVGMTQHAPSYRCR